MTDFGGGYGFGGGLGAGGSGAGGMGGGGAGSGPRINSVTPVTIRQIFSMMPQESSKPTIGNHEVRQVTFLAYVLQYDDQSKQCLVEDGTGLIYVQLPAAEGELKDYCRFTGHIVWSKTTYNIETIGLSEGPILRAYYARPVTDHNELTYHILDTITAYEKLTRAAHTSSVSSYHMSDSMSYTYRPQDTGDSGEFADSIESAKQAIIDLFHKTSSTLEFAQILSALAGQYSEGELRQACDDMIAKGNAISEDGGNTYQFVD